MVPSDSPLRAALQDIVRELRTDGIIRDTQLPKHKAENKRQESGFLAAYPFWRSEVEQKLLSRSIDFTDEHEEHLRRLLSSDRTPERRHLLWIARAGVKAGNRKLITDATEFERAMGIIAGELGKQRTTGGYLGKISEQLARNHRIQISQRDLIALRDHLNNRTTRYLLGNG